MGELFIILVGLVISIVLAILKWSAVLSISWLVVAIPTIVAIAIVLLIHGFGDGLDFDF